MQQTHLWHDEPLSRTTDPLSSHDAGKRVAVKAGDVFGRWTVKKKSRVNRRKWVARCACGVMRCVDGNNLKAGRTRSCGCLNREVSTKHGLSRTREYSAWLKMVDRCTNPEHRFYRHYGGRGITVCERWMDVTAFVEDMGKCPDGLTLERIDNNAGYEPGNCKWASRVAQARNQRSTKLTMGSARKIRQRYADGGVTQETIAGEFGVCRELIGQVVRYEIWKEVG